ncbi:MAG: leucyl aminopeptidase [Gemmatimonadetes bacterium]|nr:leucyl aminopeptidase [Gemmatimonadota bacterium]
MQVRLYRKDPLTCDTPLLAVAVFQDGESLSPVVQGAAERVGGAFSRARSAGDFRGREDEQALFYLPEGGGPGPRRVLFVGAGRRGEADAEALRRFAARAVRRAESLSVTEVALHVPEGWPGGVERSIQSAAEGAILAAWDFRELRTRGSSSGATAEDEPRPLVEEVLLCIAGNGADAEQGLRIGVAFAEAENLARVLQWRPGNVATPSHLAAVALELAEEHGFKSTVLGPVELRAEGMGALLAVSAGSAEEPRLIVLEHHGSGAADPPIVLVGKGLTFDSGGISIKPAEGMEDMKYDMSGGAAVLGAMKAIGTLDLPLNVVGIVPSSENLLSGRATKPGDVIRTRAGKTVEVINTDAEGRLILADALSYAVDHYSPKALVDCATLTGACVVALGHHAAAVLGNDEELISELREAGDRAGERCWPLPLWKEYRKQIESPIADLKNVGGKPAGTITAACFLSEFVGKTRWAHLDIAGTAYGEPRAPYQRKGGFGFPTRLLLEWVRGRAE